MLLSKLVLNINNIYKSFDKKKKFIKIVLIEYLNSNLLIVIQKKTLKHQQIYIVIIGLTLYLK